MIKIKAIVLCAGYATRLYPLTENQPKPLLNVGDKPIVEHIVDKISNLAEVDEIFVVTNHKFYPTFQSWLRNCNYKKKITVIDDGTLKNEDRLGAVGDLGFVIKEEDLDEDVLMIAGDNLFGFSLRKFYEFFQEKESSVLAFCDLKEKEKVANRLGVGILDEENKVTNFEEKPAQPSSTLAATCCYIFSKVDIKKIRDYVEKSEKWDNPGDLAKWLADRSNLHGFVFNEHWFDIGSFEGLEEASQYYEEKRKTDE